MEGSPAARRRATTQEQLEALFRNATAIVHEEFARPITLPDLAKRLASSPRQLRRAFADVGEISFRSYLREVRIAQAAELLACTDLAVGDVGERVGYRQASQFTKAFKRIRSVTPSEFRASRRGLSP